MKTYAESKNKDSFDWNKFLEKEDWTPNEIESTAELSTGWVTCACGNQCDIIPRDINGQPLDGRLYELGMNFYDTINRMSEVYERDYNEFLEMRLRAQTILSLIEERSDEIIKSITKKS